MESRYEVLDIRRMSGDYSTDVGRVLEILSNVDRTEGDITDQILEQTGAQARYIYGGVIEVLVIPDSERTHISLSRRGEEPVERSEKLISLAREEINELLKCQGLMLH